MALVHVFVPTHRRGRLLPRALRSLLAQSHADWIALVHNDDPADPEPSRVVASLNDPRIRLLAHERNLGAVGAFNRGFSEVSQSAEYFSILEDDGAWHPDFLSTLKRALDECPGAHLAWCNQTIATENPDGSWSYTTRTVHPVDSGTGRATRRMIPWGDPAQATGARMANGAMLMRREGIPPPTPGDIPFTGMEAFRERLIRHPMIYLPLPLATYSRTRQSARDADGHRWGVIQTLLLATYVRNSGMDASGIRDFWTHLRRQTPAVTNLALHAAFADRACRPLLSEASSRDWLRYLRTWMGRPGAAWACIHARKDHPAWWTMLDKATAERFAEAQLNQRSSSPP
ncbi:MAG: glycosyltransferase family 2 protein [Opitutaceae bacterium]|nr:glycosyltransferase family 2 protein [Opitutaceae bacterium]